MKNPFSPAPRLINRDAQIKFIAGNHMQCQYHAARLHQLLTGIQQRHCLTAGAQHYQDSEPHHIAQWQQQHPDLQPHDFAYVNNSHGFRCAHTGSSVDIMAFGCSVTYGVGVAVEHRWSNQLAQHTGSTVANYGIPGLGVQEIVRMFAHITRFTQPRVAVFVLPEHTRTMLSTVSHRNVNNIIYFNAFDNYAHSWPRAQWPERYQACETYFSLPMTHHVDQFLSSVHDICTMAEARGIQAVLTSWATTSNQLLQQQDVSTYSSPCSILPHTVRDQLGRDSAHPGVQYHSDLAVSMARAIAV